MTSANKSLEKKISHRVENVIKQFVHTSIVKLWNVERESRYQKVCRNFLPTRILITVELSVLVITTLH